MSCATSQQIPQNRYSNSLEALYMFKCIMEQNILEYEVYQSKYKGEHYVTLDTVKCYIQSTTLSYIIIIIITETFVWCRMMRIL